MSVLSQTLFSVPLWFWILLASYCLVIPVLWILYRRWLKRLDMKLGKYVSDYAHWHLGAGQASARAERLTCFSSNLMKPLWFLSREDRNMTLSSPGSLSVSRLHVSSGWGLARRLAYYIPGQGSLVRPLGGLGKQTDQLVLEAKGLRPLPIDQVWPQGDQQIELLGTEFDHHKYLQAQIRDVFAASFDLKTVSCAVQHRHRLVWETCAEGFDFKTPQLCKAITPFAFATVFGFLAQQRRLQIDQEIPEKKWERDGRDHILFRHLLTSTAGLNPIDEKTLDEALFGQLGGVGALIETFRIVNPVGKSRDRSASSALALSYLLSYGFGQRMDIYRDFVRTSLFNRLGMQASGMALTPDGYIQAYSGMSSTPRDLLRLATIYQNDGFWNGQRLLDQNWLSFVTTPSLVSTSDLATQKYQTGVFCCLNSAITSGKNRKPESFFKVKDKLYRHGPPYATIPGDAIFVLRDGMSLLVMLPRNKISIALISVKTPLSDDGIEIFLETVIDLVTGKGSRLP